LNGLRVTEIESGPGREAGLREGDVVVSLNLEPVGSIEQFEAASAALPESGFVQIRIVRQGQATTLTLELGD